MSYCISPLSHSLLPCPDFQDFKLVRINDDGYVFEYMPVPSGQMRFTDFADFDLAGGDVNGENSAFFPHVA
jgi:hypothetical protein